MAITLTPLGTFDGGNGVQEVNYALGETRKMDGIIRELQTQVNTNETDITGLGTPLDYKGAISLPGEFPAPGDVEDAWTYLITADVTDSDGTKTNTGQSFKTGDEIVWNGTDWTRLGRKVTQLTHSDEQAAASTETTFAFLALRAGAINDVIAVAETAAAAGEDMAIDVQINGVTCLTSAIVLDDTAGTTPQVGTVDTAANTLARGDIVTIVRTYTAGGAPTPMANTHCGIAWEENLPV